MLIKNMNELSKIFNLKTGNEALLKHGVQQQNFLRPLKIGPEPFNSDILRGVHFMTTASLPGLTRDSKDVPIQGVTLKVPGQLQFGGNETTIGFRVAGDFMAINPIQAWKFAMGNPLDGTAQFCVGRDSNIQYAVVNKANKIVRAVELVGVYPTSIGSIDYDYSGDEVVNVDVGFTYNYWQPLSLDELDLDQFAGNDSDSLQTNVANVFKGYEDIIAAKDESSEVDC